MIEIATKFVYKDARTYVNSSTLCEYLSSQIVPAIGLQNSEILLDARFHKLITRNGIMRCQDARESSNDSFEPSAEFTLAAGSKNVFVYFLEGQDPVLDRMSSTYEIKDLELLSPYAGSCRIMIRDIRSLLENTIEANKRLHLATVTDKNIKVINLYMKRFTLEPVSEKKDPAVLQIRHMGTRVYNDGIATLNSFSLPELGMPDFQMCYFLQGISL